MQVNYIKRYYAVFIVVIIGIAISTVIQNAITNNETLKRQAQFKTMATSYSFRLQEVINKENAIADTLNNALSTDINIINSPHFATLASRFMDEIQGFYGVFVVEEKNGTDYKHTSMPSSNNPFATLENYHVLSRHVRPNIESRYQLKPAVLKRTIGFDTDLIDPSQPKRHLLLFLGTETVLQGVFDGLLPNWLNLAIYRDNSGEQPKAIFRFPHQSIRDFAVPEVPTDTTTPNSLFLQKSVETVNDQLSLLFLPHQHDFFDLPWQTRWSAFLAGILFTSILSIYLLTIQRRNNLVNSLVESRTEELFHTTESLRKESEKGQALVDELSKSERQLRNVMNSIHGMFWERDLVSNRYNFTSHHVYTLTGYKPEEVYAIPNLLPSRIVEEDKGKYQTAISKLKEGDQLQVEVRTTRKDNKIIWVRIIGSPVFEDGKLTLLRGVTMDITKYKKLGEERNRLVESITQSEKELSSLANSIHGVLWKFSLKPPRYTYVSAQAEHFFGCSVQEIQDNPYYIQERVHEEDAKLVKKQMRQLASKGGKSQNVEFRMIRDDGKLIHIRNIVTPVMKKNGKVASMHGVMLDITREKTMQEEHTLLEAQLKQAQKLEAIGQLAAGIAHEINTPTQFVGDNIHYLQEAFEDLKQLCNLNSNLFKTLENGDDPKDCLEKIKSHEEEIDLEFMFEDIPLSITQSLEGTTRIRDIVKAMKDFSHPGSTNKEHTDLNQAIESTVTVARNEWKYVATLDTDFAEGLPPVELLPGEFNQVILNIVVNAAQAIGEKRKRDDSDQLGKITISTQQKDDSVLITITDTGGGIPEEIKDRVFDPFFTTKEVGKGTGQGLAIAYSVIVDKHQGCVSLETEPGVGTTFYVQLPIESPMEKSQEDPDPEPELAS